MANLRSTKQSPITGPSTGLSGRRRVQVFAFGGLLLMLMNFSGPGSGMIDLPVSFFLKNRMHLQANELAVFKLWIGLPLILGFVFGFIRDRWSPFGRGDRAHILLFGVLTALIYGLMALMTPSYAMFLGGLFVATMAFKMVSSAIFGVINTLAHKHAISGKMSSLINTGGKIPDLISFIGGGMLSQTLGGQNAEAAARILFCCAGGLMVSIAVLGVVGPKWRPVMISRPCILCRRSGASYAAGQLSGNANPHAVVFRSIRHSAAIPIRRSLARNRRPMGPVAGHL